MDDGATDLRIDDRLEDLTDELESRLEEVADGLEQTGEEEARGIDDARMLVSIQSAIEATAACSRRRRSAPVGWSHVGQHEAADLGIADAAAHVHETLLALRMATHIRAVELLVACAGGRLAEGERRHR